MCCVTRTTVSIQSETASANSRTLDICQWDPVQNISFHEYWGRVTRKDMCVQCIMMFPVMRATLTVKDLSLPQDG